MTALIIAPVSLPWPLFLVACLFTLTALLFVAKDGNRRLIGALLLACILAAPAILRAEEESGDDFIIRNKCATLTMSDWQYWWYGCEFLPR